MATENELSIGEAVWVDIPLPMGRKVYGTIVSAPVRVEGKVGVGWEIIVELDESDRFWSEDKTHYVSLLVCSLDIVHVECPICGPDCNCGP